MTRKVLPNRRRCEIFDFKVGRVPYTGAVGLYHDGQIGEVFLNGGKVASDTDIAARDAAISTSIAIQHGTPVEAIRAALTRRVDGTAEGGLGVFLDMLKDYPVRPWKSRRPEGA